MALYGEKLSFKVSLRVGGRVGGWVNGRVVDGYPIIMPLSGPQLTAEAEFESVELVSWGQVCQ